MISPTRVREIVKSSLLGCTTLEEAQNDTDGIRVNGVTATFYFSKSKIEKFKNEISEMIDMLDPKFKSILGASFVMLCVDKNGVLWTGEHVICEDLLLLGIAINKMEIVEMDEMIINTLGGVPFVKIIE